MAAIVYIYIHTHTDSGGVLIVSVGLAQARPNYASTYILYTYISICVHCMCSPMSNSQVTSSPVYPPLPSVPVSAASEDSLVLTNFIKSGTEQKMKQ